MLVNDLVVFQDKEFKQHRCWVVKSVCLSALGYESLVELQPLTEKPGQDVDGMTHKTTWVPEPLLRNAAIYRLVEG